MPQPTPIHQLVESYWLSYHNEKIILDKLLKKGVSEEELNWAKAYIKKKKCSARRANGALWLIAGVIMLGVGFISTVFLFHSGNSFQLVMYGLTVWGIIAVGLGCYFIFSE